MSTFTSRINIVTGNNEWIFVDDDKFDYQQELARSAFADMLHDHERNVQYEQAIRKTINVLSKSVDRIHVLDIGTGTGLLSMMAARAWNDMQTSSSSLRITACEVFQPMANIAKKCIDKNGLADRIHVIDRRSTELHLDNDLQGDRINVIVAEVFDTELIGEGALRTFSEACRHLTVDRDNLRIIPARAIIYIQLVESSMLQDFHTLKDLSSSSKRVIIPDDCRHLAGNSIFDLNVNEICHAIRPLSKPIPVFHFDFKHLDESKQFNEEKLLKQIFCEQDGRIDAMIMWWNLDMDEDGDIQLGTTPVWCHDQQTSSIRNVQWREHWIHGIYYPHETRTVKAHEQASDKNIMSYSIVYESIDLLQSRYLSIVFTMNTVCISM
jgi:type III protein arginine methyltransferase